jgi:SAM-dependent methyltransferase
MLAALARHFRKARAAHFAALLARIPRPVRILDVGGTEVYWDQVGLKTGLGGEVVLLNLDPVETRTRNFVSIVGDACDLSRFPDKSFDLVFSNSVIEHVGALDRQQRMALEVMRVGKRYYVQTPNRHFPIEPHYVLPLFQFYPKWLKVIALRFFALTVNNGRTRRSQLTAQEATVEAKAIELLSGKQFRSLFPGCRIWEERFGPLTKSFVAYGGWV